MMYTLAPNEGFHSICNSAPTRVNLNAAGGNGGPVHPGPPPIWNGAGGDGAPAVLPLMAVTVTLKPPCVPGGIVTVSVVTGPTWTAATTAPDARKRKSSRYVGGRRSTGRCRPRHRQQGPVHDRRDVRRDTGRRTLRLYVPEENGAAQNDHGHNARKMTKYLHVPVPLTPLPVRLATRRHECW